MSIIPIGFYYKDHSLIFELLANLTSAPLIEKTEYLKIINDLPQNQHVFVYMENNKPLGLITLLIEQKLIHGGKCVGHIEDLVVDPNFQGKGIGSKLLNFVLDEAKKKHCYKVILDCDENAVKFYEKNNFIKKEVQMRYNL